VVSVGEMGSEAISELGTGWERWLIHRVGFPRERYRIRGSVGGSSRGWSWSDFVRLGRGGFVGRIFLREESRLGETSRHSEIQSRSGSRDQDDPRWDGLYRIFVSGEVVIGGRFPR